MRNWSFKCILRAAIKDATVLSAWMSGDLMKAGTTQTETSLLKQYVACESVDLLDD